MSFRLKLTLCILLVVTVYLTAFTWLMLRRELTLGLDVVRDSVLSNAEVLGSGVSNALVTYDFATVDVAASRLVQAPGISAVRIFTPAGDVITQHGDFSTSAAQDLSGAAFYLYVDPSRSTVITRDIMAATGPVGSIEIRADLSEINTQINALAGWGLFVGGLGCFVVVATGWWVAALFARRIDRLAIGARRIASGDLEFRLAVRGTDELANIGEAIDTMADSLIAGRQKAETMARRDPLTGLLNRAGVAEAMTALNGAARPMTALHVDLDRFKLINDTQGHLAGDAVLKAVAQQLKAVCSDAYALARNGGDEFLVILDHIPGDGAAQILGQDIITATEVPVAFGEATFRVSASVGISDLPAGPHSEDVLENLVVEADIALYQAKMAGRSCVATFDEDARAAREAEADLEWEISGALKASAFTPFIQPQVDMVSGQIVGAEILARWHHPVRGILTPSRFLVDLRNGALAEAIDDQVRSKALSWMARAGRERPDSISINFTPSQMARIGSASAFSNDIEAIGLTPEQVVIEVNEDVILDSGGIVDENLRTLIERGHSLELDDFGTGNASLQNLIRITVQTLKIDRSFVSDIDADPVRSSIVSAIIGMARALNLRVLAEGVETEAEQDKLVQLGCSIMQGFLYAEPMPLEDYHDWAQNWRKGRKEHAA